MEEDIPLAVPKKEREKEKEKKTKKKSSLNIVTSNTSEPSSSDLSSKTIKNEDSMQIEKTKMKNEELKKGDEEGNKFFLCTDFKGRGLCFKPAALITAPSSEIARKMLVANLSQNDKYGFQNEFTLTELKTGSIGVLLVSDGDLYVQ